MNTMNARHQHPALVRTTNAFATVGARQRRNALPAVVLAAAALGLQLGALASIFA